MRPGRARLAAVTAAVGLAAAGVAGISGMADADGAAGRAVTVRDAGGDLLAQVPLSSDRFAVSYRNSVYRSIAEERYRVASDGRFVLVELAADQLAVLEEYYAVPGPAVPAPATDRRSWVAQPSRTAVFIDLDIAATELGERTVHVPDHAPVPLPPLAADDPTVVLTVEEVP